MVEQNSNISNVRVRFAPSPTGFLHIGGVRTALFNHLFARKNNGVFILRIEDTDTERSNPTYTDDILKSMQWLGLNWDEGPIFQSTRFDRYCEVCQDLVASGHAYYCYCTPAELEEERKAMEVKGQKPMYSRKCRELGHKSPDPKRGAAVIRCKVPNHGQTTFHDLIRGPISFKNSEIDDFVLLRANGTPTYNLACVVDDFDGKITHVVRGDDHINNTPKQCILFSALKFTTPKFVHLPMILGSDKKKLSKRHGSVSANQYRSDGFLPNALVNYLARLGWSHGDQEIFSRDELIQYFSLEKIGKSNAVFNTEKLLWLNAHYIRQADTKALSRILLDDFQTELNGFGKIQSLDSKLTSLHGQKLIELSKQKVRTIKELAVLLAPVLWDGPIQLDLQVSVQWKKTQLEAPLEHVITELRHLTKDEPKILFESNVDAKTIETLYRATADRFGMKLVELAQPTRFFLQGTTVGPSLFDLMAELDWKVVEKRLSRHREVLTP